ncbi:pyrroline-5-carboxylate reductase [Helicobacter mesocricetorum]|uniref:pyrroline-5-carboxylate reductase n=1 Tax=Helicobacter mesocricetorum TaxID=87012 RepID=UPI000CF02E82|nr:pyrroline-5-carboxylate reductase [Helicobacter mesocricetorum]
MKTLLIVGYGKMAKAICEGLKGKFEIQVCGRDSKKIEDFCSQFQATPQYNPKEIKIDNKEVLLCIKPYALNSFQFTGEAKCLYSILNAIPLETLRKAIQSKYYIRAMPNVCASVGKSMTSLCGDESYKNEAVEIFNSIGDCIWLEETLFPIATALSGCAPAFLALVAESIIDSAVTNGLTREQATRIVKTLFAGFGTLLQTQHPTFLKENVMSPGGSTAQGIASLEKNALRNAFFEAILASKNSA